VKESEWVGGCEREESVDKEMSREEQQEGKWGDLLTRPHSFKTLHLLALPRSLAK